MSHLHQIYFKQQKLLDQLLLQIELYSVVTETSFFSIAIPSQKWVNPL